MQVELRKSIDSNRVGVTYDGHTIVSITFMNNNKSTVLLSPNSKIKSSALRKLLSALREKKYDSIVYWYKDLADLIQALDDLNDSAIKIYYRAKDNGTGWKLFNKLGADKYKKYLYLSQEI